MLAYREPGIERERSGSEAENRTVNSKSSSSSSLRRCWVLEGGGLRFMEATCRVQEACALPSCCGFAFSKVQTERCGDLEEGGRGWVGWLSRNLRVEESGWGDDSHLGDISGVTSHMSFHSVLLATVGSPID